MIPSSTAVFTAAAASLLLGHALATSSSQTDPVILPAYYLSPDGPVQWPQTQDTAAPAALTGHQASHEAEEEESTEGTPEVTVPGSTLTREPQLDSSESKSESRPLDGMLDPERQPELRRSEDGGAAGTVLLRRETSAAPTIYGVSIWLIIAWLALLYFMYKTGSMF